MTIPCGRLLATLLGVGLLSNADAGAGSLSSRAGEFEVKEKDIAVASKSLTATYVTPVHPRHPGMFVAFFTGDAGWMGASGDLFEHLAEAGYFVAGYNSRAALGRLEVEEGSVSPAAAGEGFAQVFAQARHDLGLSASTPLIAIGFSRGASMVVFTSITPSLQRGLVGAVAIALTQESDYLRAPDPASRPPALEVDEKERILLYPALALTGTLPLAVIQSTGDKYVSAREARQLFGSDSTTRRLYSVEAKNHGFSGGRDALMRDLDDALNWIVRVGPPATSIGR